MATQEIASTLEIGGLIFGGGGIAGMAVLLWSLRPRMKGDHYR